MLNTAVTKKQIAQTKRTQEKKQAEKKEISKTLEGVLVNNHIKNDEPKQVTIDEICDTLLLTRNNEKTKNTEKEKAESFNYKKTLIPLLIGVGVTFGAACGLSFIVRKNSKNILKKYCEELPPIAHNMNIPEEPHLAVYELLRNPSPRNILGAGAVFLFSGLTISAKNFVDGIKEIWIKKREANIERDLQENLIEVEANAFSGKLQSVNSYLKDSANYFKTIFKEQDEKNLKFKGKEKEKENKSVQIDTKKNSDKKKYMQIAGLGAFAVACGILGKITFSNLRKTCTEMDKFAKDTVEEGIKQGKIFSNASSGLSGDAGLISYYSYLNEPRGHLYNWILNPENTFLKNIFLSFTAVSAIGYLFKQGMDAIKTVSIAKENSKTELNLKKRLVEVEIENFKAKKTSAIEPLMNEFRRKVASGEKSEKELKQFAENILFEIKNGPPYVYS
ncbi:hypothetical protein IJC60_06495 [bacterium]|nr:hypothetical protein [bacterium]